MNKLKNDDMTLRDWFAGQVCTALMTMTSADTDFPNLDYRRHPDSLPYAERVAHISYQMADAMLRARGNEMTDRCENKCKFVIAGAGRCNAVTSQGDFCDTHLQKECCVCGSQADHECSHTGRFVCGAPLCPSCEGYEDSDKPRGIWGFFNHGHRRMGTSNG